VLILPVQRFLISSAWRAEALREFFQFLALQERRGVPLAESLDHLQAPRSKKSLLRAFRWTFFLSIGGIVGLSVLIVALAFYPFSGESIDFLAFLYTPLLTILFVWFLLSFFLDVFLTTEDYCQELAARLFPAVSKGTPLSEAMRCAGGWFPTLAVDLVAAGEETNQVAETLKDLANYLKADQTVPCSEWALVFYPFPTVVVALNLFGGIMIFIMPKFVAIFTELGMEIPWATRWVIDHSFLGLWGASGATLFFLLTVVYSNCRFVGGRSSQSWLTRLPVIRLFAPPLVWILSLFPRLPLVRQWVQPLVLSQFLLVLGRFLRVHAPMPDALQRAGDLVQGTGFDRLGQRAARGVQQGLSLSQALEAESAIPAGICQMVRLAERNETLPERCLDLAQTLREKWFFRTQRLIRILEPLILLAVGLLVGIIALALYLPLFNLSSAMSQKIFE
jgi:type II secretory pathway component PulF